MAKADEINASLVRKHEKEIIKLKEDKIEAERRLELQTRDMAAEMERLQKVRWVKYAIGLSFSSRRLS